MCFVSFFFGFWFYFLTFCGFHYLSILFYFFCLLNNRSRARYVYTSFISLSSTSNWQITKTYFLLINLYHVSSFENHKRKKKIPKLIEFPCTMNRMKRSTKIIKTSSSSTTICRCAFNSTSNYFQFFFFFRCLTYSIPRFLIQYNELSLNSIWKPYILCV